MIKVNSFDNLNNSVHFFIKSIADNIYTIHTLNLDINKPDLQWKKSVEDGLSKIIPHKTHKLSDKESIVPATRGPCVCPSWPCCSRAPDGCSL